MYCFASPGKSLCKANTISHLDYGCPGESRSAMPDYIYLLENRLSADQRHALAQLRTAARDAGILLFLTGDVVRDLTSGHAVRELEAAVHGNALKLKKSLEKHGAKIWGEDEAARSLYLCFPGTVRVDLVSTQRVEFPKPGKPVYHPASIHEDLRRRDFTANAMAISLNEGSFGLLMDPLNGAADIESRTLRLVSNYGFLEEPSLLIRATRFRARLGWEMDPRTHSRYDNAKAEDVIEHLSSLARSRELEQIGHEEDGLKVLRALEAEGWMKVLFPAWTSAKADEAKLAALHELLVGLEMQNVHPDISAAQMQLLTAKMQSKDLSSLKRQMLRPGFVAEWNSLDSLASGFAKVLLDKKNAKPSAGYKLFMSYDPESVLWLGFTSKQQAVKDRYDLFLKTWPETRQKIPYALMQEMRITPELANYNEIVEKVFLELIDGNLTTPEEMRAFLEPFSPPAPPPPPTYKKTRAKRAEAKLKDEEPEEEEDEDLGTDEELEDLGGDEEIDLEEELPKDALKMDLEDDEVLEEDEAESEEEEESGAAKKKSSAAPAKKGQKVAPSRPAESAKAKPAAEKAKPAAEKPKPAPEKGKAAPAAKKKPEPAAKAPSPAKAAQKIVEKAKAKPPAKPQAAAKKPAPAKAKPAKPAVKHAPAKPAKAAAKRPAAKAGKKR
jgi:tRNA nucleotidyltransferase/poly(A) polymerase